GDSFGSSASTDGRFVVVGATSGDGPAPNSGTAAVFDARFIGLSGLVGDCNSNGDADLFDILISQTSADCNGNGVPDECDIAAGAADLNTNGVPDECEAACPSDINGDGAVTAIDLAMLLGEWGACPSGDARAGRGDRG